MHAPAASRTQAEASAPLRRCDSFGAGVLCASANPTTAESLGCCRAVFDVVASALDASSGAALCALDALPDAALCALDASPDVVAACRLAERGSLRSEEWGACTAPGPQPWVPLAPWTEPPKPTWRVPEWKKSFDAKEFPFEFFRSCRPLSFFCRNHCTLYRGGIILRRCDAR
jgi:hypothetical protein